MDIPRCANTSQEAMSNDIVGAVNVYVDNIDSRRNGTLSTHKNAIFD